jgi:putative sterol carrier protein
MHLLEIDMPTPAESLTDLVKRFRPDAAEGLDAVYQLHLTNEHGGFWHLTIADGQCRLSPGSAPSADVVITMSVEDWSELVAGRLDGFSAYLQGRIQITGDLSLVARLQSLFGL